MSFTYSRTEQGGIIAEQSVSGDSVTAAELSARQSSMQKSLAFRDEGEFGSHSDVVVRNGYAYAISSDGNTLRVIDISNPLSPELAGTWDSGDRTDLEGVEPFGDRIALSANNSSGNPGIVVLDASDLTSISVDIEGFDSGWTKASDIHGIEPYYNGTSDLSILHTAGENAEYRSFQIDNVSSPTSLGSNPVLTNEVPSIDFAYDPKLRNADIVHAASEQFFGKAWDVSDPTAPTSFSGLPQLSSGNAQDVKALDNPDFSLGISDTGLVGIAFDRGSNQEQEEQGELDTSAQTLKSVTLHDDVAVAVGGSQAVSVDISRPYNPGEIAVEQIGFDVESSSKFGDITVVAGDQFGLLI